MAQTPTMDRASADGADSAGSLHGSTYSTPVKEILSWYRSEPAGVQAKLAWMMNTGRLSGTGRMVILPVDQGFEHGPARSFARNPAGYDPRYHIELAIDSGCNAYAAPLGALAAVAADYAGEIPLILKLNNSDSLYGGEQPAQAVTGSVQDALRLGCAAIGYTIYPGSEYSFDMYESLRDLIAEAREVGIPSVVWSYPRGGKLDKVGETAVDVVAYAAHIACQLGAHVVKVKPPTADLWLGEAKKVYQSEKIPVDTLAERIQHVVQSCFGGRRIVIFSGGASKDTDSLIEEVRSLAQGGAFGSIMGRNSFQRPKPEAIDLLHRVQDVFREAAEG